MRHVTLEPSDHAGRSGDPGQSTRFVFLARNNRMPMYSRATTTTTPIPPSTYPALLTFQVMSACSFVGVSMTATLAHERFRGLESRPGGDECGTLNSHNVFIASYRRRCRYRVD